MTETYNGWTNYQTWLFNLHWDFEDEALLFYKNAEANGSVRKKDQAIFDLSLHMYDAAKQSIPDTNNPWINDILLTQLKEIDFDEIATHYINASANYITEIGA